MNPVQLFHQDGTPTGIWYCSGCRQVHRTCSEAERCCAPRLCSCGAEASKYRTVCDPCLNRRDEERERARFEAAEKTEAWGGPVFHGDSLYWDLDSCLDSLDSLDEIPPYLWTAVGKPFVKVRLEHVLESVLEDGWEDFDTSYLAGVEDLEKAVKAFEEANKDLLVYEPNYKLALILNP